MFLVNEIDAIDAFLAGFDGLYTVQPHAPAGCWRRVCTNGASVRRPIVGTSATGFRGAQAPAVRFISPSSAAPELAAAAPAAKQTVAAAATARALRILRDATPGAVASCPGCQLRHRQRPGQEHLRERTALGQGVRSAAGTRFGVPERAQSLLDDGGPRE